MLRNVESFVARQAEGWLAAIASGSRAGVEASWEVARPKLGPAIRRPFEASSLARTTFTPNDILDQTHGAALMQPAWLLFNRTAYPKDPVLTLWLAWLEAAEQMLREVSQRYDLVWAPDTGLVSRLACSYRKEATLVRFARKKLQTTQCDHRVSSADAEDAVGEAFRRLIDRGGRAIRRPILEGPAVSEVWLRRVFFTKVKSVVVDRARGRAWRHYDLKFEPKDTSQSHDQELDDAIEQAFQRLNPEDELIARKALLLRVEVDEITGQRRSYKAIAAELGLEIGELDWVRRTLKRAIRGILPGHRLTRPARRPGRPGASV